MRAKKTRAKALRRLVLYLGAVFLCGYLALTLVFSQMDIVVKRRQLEALDGQIAAQQQKNTELESLLKTEGGKAYLEKIAREKLQYAQPGERVFVDMTGK